MDQRLELHRAAHAGGLLWLHRVLCPPAQGQYAGCHESGLHPDCRVQGPHPPGGHPAPRPAQLGSFFIESVFSIPGLGLYYVNAVAAQDVTIVMGETVILAALYIIVVFVTDILYTVVDPRIRIRGGKR